MLPARITSAYRFQNLPSWEPMVSSTLNYFLKETVTDSQCWQKCGEVLIPQDHSLKQYIFGKKVGNTHHMCFKMFVFFDPIIPYLGIIQNFLRELKQKMLCIVMFITALFRIKWKQPVSNRVLANYVNDCL